MSVVADLLQDIAAFLQANNIISGEGVDAFLDFAPASPDNIVALYEYGGVPGTVGSADVRNIQVMVRHEDPSEARQKAWQIFNILDVPDDRIIYLTSSRWTIILARQTPSKIGVDEQNRSLWGFNLSITTHRD